MKLLVTTASTIALVMFAAAQQGDKPAQPNVPSGHPSIPVPEVTKNWPQARPEDVNSVDAILRAFYEAPAGEANQPRNWDRYLSLFVPDARLIVARPGQNGTAGTIFLAAPDYVAANKTYFEKGGFMDKEVARRTESIANIVQVWSTYESRRSVNDPAPYLRGINSIQLLKDGDRYWIVNVFWDNEKPDVTIPEKYLTSRAD